MIALTVTCRPQWLPWLAHQLAKQACDYRLVLFDDTTDGLMDSPLSRALTGTVTCRPSNRLQLSLGQKRQCLLDLIKDTKEPFAWFDDDDWHPKERLLVGRSLITGPALPVTAPIHVVGYHEGLFVDVKTLQTRKLDTGESVCFNSAVFAPECAAVPFQPLHRGEDTMWLRSVLKDKTIVTTPTLQHCWMSHDRNVTGKRGSMSFEGPKFQRFDSWELEFLRNL